MSTFDFKVKQLKKQSFEGFKQSELHLNLSGKHVNKVIVNTLRRACLELVPSYAFSPKTINIEKNTSIFDNDEMRCRLSQVPIFNVNVPITLLSEKYWKDVNYADPDRPKHPDDKITLEMYINAKNDTKDVMQVTTKNSKFYEDGTEVDKFSKIEAPLLIELRPDEIFKCHMVGVLGVGLGKGNNIFSATSTTFMKENNPKNEVEPHNYNLIVESSGQLDEYEILNRVCDILIKKVSDTKENIKRDYTGTEIEKSQFLELVLLNETHTIGNLINDHLQDHPDVEFSGYAKPDQNENRIIIKMKTKTLNPIKTFNDTIDKLIIYLKNVQKAIKK